VRNLNQDTQLTGVVRLCA